MQQEYKPEYPNYGLWAYQGRRHIEALERFSPPSVKMHISHRQKSRQSSPCTLLREVSPLWMRTCTVTWSVVGATHHLLNYSRCTGRLLRDVGSFSLLPSEKRTLLLHVKKLRRKGDAGNIASPKPTGCNLLTNWQSLIRAFPLSKQIYQWTSSLSLSPQYSVQQAYKPIRCRKSIPVISSGATVGQKRCSPICT